MARGSAATRAHLATVLGDRPEVLDQLEAADTAAWEAVDADLLDLCRIRIAMLLGHPDEVVAQAPPEGPDPQLVAELVSWPTSTRFDDTQRACLAFTEQFVIDVATMDDALAFAVVDHLGADFPAFVNALLVIEQRQRLTLTWQRLFADAAPSTATPSINEETP